MTTQAFVGRSFLYRGDGGSPEVFTRVCQAFGISGIGQTNEQIDATTFCSNGVKEYIPGLADGSEITLELNFEGPAQGGQVILDMIGDVKNKATRDFELRFDTNGDGTDTDVVFHFSMTCLSWTINPSPSAKNSVSFTGKITGDINITTG